MLKTYKQRAVIFIVTVMVATFGVFGIALAATDVIAKSYSVNNSVVIASGALVSLASDNSKVELSNTENQQKLIGVAVAKDGSLLTVASADGTVEVAISGETSLLISDINGKIVAGDKVAPSPISGIGMKADAGSTIIGVAKDSFKSTSPTTQSREITDKTGQKKTVQIGVVGVDIGITNIENNNADNSKKDESGFVGAIKSLANALTGHEVSMTQIILSFFVTIIALIVIGVLVYGAIKNGITATGRNPLARPAIFEAIIQVLFMVVVIAIVTIVTVLIILG